MATNRRGRADRKKAPTYGIAEWYGHSFVRLTPRERRDFAKDAIVHLDQTKDSLEKIERPCPFKGGLCTKKGGICSLRRYEEIDGGSARPLDDRIVTICPYRFQQNDTIFEVIADKILKVDEFRVLGQIPFLKRIRTSATVRKSDKEGVGRIDNIIVAYPITNPLQWHPIELQAVYFSGEKMKHLFTHIGGLNDDSFHGDGIPFPDRRRGPDWRSSGVKRLMPQIQIKAPPLVRWHHKLVIVTDQEWYQANVGDTVASVDESNCDLYWVVVDFKESGNDIDLVVKKIHYLKIDDTVNALTGGRPTAQPEFEAKIVARINEKFD